MVRFFIGHKVLLIFYIVATCHKNLQHLPVKSHILENLKLKLCLPSNPFICNKQFISNIKRLRPAQVVLLCNSVVGWNGGVVPKWRGSVRLTYTSI